MEAWRQDTNLKKKNRAGLLINEGRRRESEIPQMPWLPTNAMAPAFIFMPILLCFIDFLFALSTHQIKFLPWLKVKSLSVGETMHCKVFLDENEMYGRAKTSEF